jgi:hypothetical protein
MIARQRRLTRKEKSLAIPHAIEPWLPTLDAWCSGYRMAKGAPGDPVAPTMGRGANT